MTLTQIYEKRVDEGNNQFVEAMMLGKTVNALIGSGYSDEEIASLIGGETTPGDVRAFRNQRSNR